MADFNLLHFPTLDRQETWRRQWHSGWMGVAFGFVLAGCWVQWQIIETDKLQQALHELQTRLNERQRQAQLHQQAAKRNQALQQQWTQLTQLQSRQHVWTLFQSSLLEDAQRLGLSLQRLQVEAGRIDIQGQAPTAQAMSHALQHLSERWGQPLRLVSMEMMSVGDAALSPVSFAWQANWPGLGDTVVPLTQAKQVKP
ncbi:hypothetical protein [Limnohabitans sp. Jir72]|uniref:hypothetical protein n=1 Tax=Limnohabitans sp. Jir72 TaxID=1977909 RepID=UPI000D3BED12|nr:hypothetical protein [Limnohabitans sp. Jir72]